MELPFAKADEMPTIRCLPVLNLVWLCLLSIGLLILWSTSVENGTFHPPKSVAVVEPAPHRVGEPFIYRFNVALPRSEVGRGMRFSLRVPSTGYLPIADLALVRSYHVCCMTVEHTHLVCAAEGESGRVGTSAILHQERISAKVYATVSMAHSDMIGATCSLLWHY